MKKDLTRFLIHCFPRDDARLLPLHTCILLSFLVSCFFQYRVVFVLVTCIAKVLFLFFRDERDDGEEGEKIEEVDRWEMKNESQRT